MQVINLFNPSYGCVFELADFCYKWNIPFNLEKPPLFEGYILRFPSGADIAVHSGVSMGIPDLVEFGKIGRPDLDYSKMSVENAAKIIPKIIGKLVK